jgi:glycosyltransferase involved in cell wall biosynthesis
MKPSLALSMIVRDAAALLPACLSSVRGIVDEIVIADTGSRDDTIAVARSLGADIFRIPWTNDFAAARNLSLDRVRSDWVLSLDADEQLDPAAVRQIPGHLKRTEIAGFQVTIRNYVLSLNDRVWDRPAKPNDSPRLPAAQQYPAFVEHENVRLFRRDPRIRFVGRVHESVGPSVLAVHRKLAAANFLIHHFGLAADEKTRAAKNRFYRELGRQKLLEMPQHPQAHLELGLVEMDNFSNLEEARRLFERARSLDPRFALAWFFEGVALSKLDRHQQALVCFQKAEQLGQRTALAAELAADSFYNLRQFPSAADSYRLALRRDPSNPLVESKLGLAELRSGDTPGGLFRLRRAVASRPAAPELHDRLILALVWIDGIPDAAQAAAQKLTSVSSPSATDYLRSASLWARLADGPRAHAALASGLLAFPNHPGLAQASRDLQSSLNRQNLLSQATPPI